MQVADLHPWAVTPKEAIRIQREIAGQVCSEPFDIDHANIIAGADVSSTKFDKILTAGVIVWDRDTGSLLETTFAQREESMPYIPGLLSFREIPVLIEAIRALKIKPDAFLVDGHGIAHPRRLGIAAHLGLLIDVPSVGVAKSTLTGRGDEPGPAAGSHAPLCDGDEHIGEIVRLKDGCKPVYVSIGNRITLQDAMELTLSCTHGYRLPEPTRLAHLHVNAARTTGHGLPVSATPTRL